MSNVTTFPSSQRMPGNWIVHGGRVYRNIEHVMESLTSREWRRMVEWERMWWERNNGPQRSEPSAGGSAA